MDFERLYARPVAEQATPAEVQGVRPFWVGLRSYVAAVIGFGLLGLVTGGVLQWEFLDPEPTLSGETYRRSFSLHAVTLFASASPLGMGGPFLERWDSLPCGRGG